ncbi:MAG: DNA topoisomerase VI subunit B [Candidatus Diapherotrites archaeon]|nr:DNA topoisomerase VI subunit B [Candidatus Diapherotrites archaeon]
MIDITDEIFSEFKEHSVAEFFKKNKQMLGFTGKVKSLTTIVHEYVTNSLDACEEASILPDITIKIDKIGNEHYRVTSRDNGPGMPKKVAGKALGQLLAGTKFHRRIQSRGQQGIGASGCTMFSQITTGKSTKLISGLENGTIYETDVKIDVKRNMPELTNEKEYKDEEIKGTTIIAEFKTVTYNKGEYGPLEYIKRTALANPHTTIRFEDPDGELLIFERAVEKIPPVPKEMLPHPKGMTADDILTRASKSNAYKIKSFLMTDFARISSSKANEIGTHVSFDLNKRPQELKWDEAEEMVEAFKNIKFMAPETNFLIPIGDNQLTKAMQQILEPEFLAVVERNAQIYRGGVPFQVEVSLGYGGKAGRSVEKEETSKVEVLRYANRAPLLFDGGGCVISQAVSKVDWKRYELRNINESPVTIFVNVSSAHIPYTSAGKQAISDEDEILEEIRNALMDAGRKLKSHLSGKRRLLEKERKKKIFEKYIPETAKSLEFLTGTSKTILEQKLEEIVGSRFAELAEAEALENGNGEAAQENEAVTLDSESQEDKITDENTITEEHEKTGELDSESQEDKIANENTITEEETPPAEKRENTDETEKEVK